MRDACAPILECHGETLRLLADELGDDTSGLAHDAATMKKTRMCQLDAPACFSSTTCQSPTMRLLPEARHSSAHSSSCRIHLCTAVHAAPAPLNENVASVPVTEFATPPAATFAATAAPAPATRFAPSNLLEPPVPVGPGSSGALVDTPVCLSVPGAQTSTSWGLLLFAR